MRTKFVAVGVIAAALISQAWATSYTLTMYSTANPGGYWADPDGALESVLSNYATEAKGDSGNRFWTMCLETDEYFWSGKKYYASITGTVANGGGSNTNNGDPISVGTAYLYKQFATGNLDNLGFSFTYNSTGGARVQNTIWALEGEAGKVADTVLLNHLTSVFGVSSSSQGTGFYAGYSGNEVQVMNLTRYDGTGGDGQTQYGTLRQDQLVLSHVPDGGATLGFLGGAFLILTLARRRLA